MTSTIVCCKRTVRDALLWLFAVSGLCFVFDVNPFFRTKDTLTVAAFAHSPIKDRLQQSGEGRDGDLYRYHACYQAR